MLTQYLTNLELRTRIQEALTNIHEGHTVQERLFFRGHRSKLKLLNGDITEILIEFDTARKKVYWSTLNS